jgi:hypothetical protein
LIEDVGPAGVDDPFERVRQTIARAHVRRGGRTPSLRAQLIDPLGRDRAFYRETVDRLFDLSVRLAVGLFGDGAVRPLRRQPIPSESSHGRGP